MKSVSKKLFILSFIIAVAAAGLGYYYLDSLNNQNDEIKVEKIKILVASQHIEPRTKISKNMIKEIEISPDSNFGDFIDKSVDIVGKYSKESIFKDERFHVGSIYNESSDDLSLRIKGDHRAMSINTDGSSGVSDLLKSGDFVDVFVYLPQLQESNRIVRPDLSKLLLQNIEVLAIDKEMNTEVDREVPPSYLVTLSVPIVDAEKLVLAEDVGKIKLALRPLEKDYLHQTDGTIWEELLIDDNYKIKDLFPQYEIKIDQKETTSEYKYTKYYYYTIKYGDTLRKISKKFYGNDDKYLLIKRVNKIDDENSIISGTGIKIPVLGDE
jgi:pilus assembly protein CpaB